LAPNAIRIGAFCFLTIRKPFGWANRLQRNMHFTLSVIRIAV
jgi:hypothetical protein